MMGTTLSESDVHALLAQRRRQLLLRILENSSTPLTAIELAKRIGEHEYEDPSDDSLRAIFVSLHHNHLPKLERADAITYDKEAGTVSPSSNFGVLVDTLEGVSGRNGSRTGQ